MSTKAKTAPRYFADQLDGEEVLLVFRKHPVVMRKGLIIGMLALLIGPLYTLALTYLRPNNMPSVGFFFESLLFSAILGFILYLPAWIHWYYSIFIVSDQRLIQITQKGLFHRSVVDIGLNQIQIVNYEISGFQETLLGFGTITMQTYLGELIIHEVHHPTKIQKRILEILRDQGVLAASYPPLDNNALLGSQAEEGESSIDEA